MDQFTRNLAGRMNMAQRSNHLDIGTDTDIRK